MYLDTDLNHLTGCETAMLGMEFGVTFAIPFGGYIGDARDCSWGPADFPNALQYEVSGKFLEAAISMDILRVLTPNLTSLNIAAANDSTSFARYNLAYPVSGCVQVYGSPIVSRRVVLQQPSEQNTITVLMRTVVTNSIMPFRENPSR
jgi:hypothetical protein